MTAPPDGQSAFLAEWARFREENGQADLSTVYLAVKDVNFSFKLMRREVVERLQLTQPHFAANAETGLQPMLMGFSVKEVPISWINRTPDMGMSSFRLAAVGRGYWQVLFRLWFKTVFRRRKTSERLPGSAVRKMGQR